MIKDMKMPTKIVDKFLLSYASQSYVRLALCHWEGHDRVPANE